jgi:hypothetical protein
MYQGYYQCFPPDENIDDFTITWLRRICGESLKSPQRLELLHRLHLKERDESCRRSFLKTIARLLDSRRVTLFTTIVSVEKR